MSDIPQSILNKARKDKFLLILNVPNALKSIDTPIDDTRKSSKVDFDTLQYSVFGNVVPDIAINPFTLNFGGQPMKITSQQREPYSNITVSFTVDNGYNNWWVLWKWLNYINDSKYGITNKDNLKTDSINEMTNYQTTITVFGLDEYNNQKIQFTYYKAFITNLTGIKYDYKDPNQIESSFSFAFSQLGADLLT